MIKNIIEKIVSVYKQRVLCLTIPAKIATFLGIEKGTLIKWTVDTTDEVKRATLEVVNPIKEDEITDA